jgi:hypothetical protein
MTLHHVVTAVNGREYIVESYHKLQTAKDVAEMREIQTGTEHYVISIATRH